jgi:hypothetical protein
MKSPVPAQSGVPIRIVAPTSQPVPAAFAVRSVRPLFFSNQAMSNLPSPLKSDDGRSSPSSASRGRRSVRRTRRASLADDLNGRSVDGVPIFNCSYSAGGKVPAELDVAALHTGE